MATNKQQTTDYKLRFYCIFLVFLGLLVRWCYLFISNIAIKKKIDSVKEDIQVKQVELDSFSNKLGFNKLQYVKDLENNNSMMPRSDHVHAIMSIFDELLSVDKSDTFNIEFSNFEISLENVRLDGHVTNLLLLYDGGPNGDSGLIEKFEELDFLDNISIRTYQKSSNDFGYEFTLTANVINNGK